MTNIQIKSCGSWIGCALATFGCIAFCFLICGGVLFYDVFYNSLASAGPKGVLRRETGLRLPPSATVVSSGDTHGGFTGDGEFHAVFAVDGDTIDRFLASSPVPPLSEWQSGPVPTEIGFHCSFGTDGVGAVSVDGGPTRYSGDRELESLLASPTIMYSAHERCCDSIEWHNGTLLIADRDNQKVWLSIWDF